MASEGALKKRKAKQVGEPEAKKLKTGLSTPKSVKSTKPTPSENSTPVSGSIQKQKGLKEPSTPASQSTPKQTPLGDSLASTQAKSTPHSKDIKEGKESEGDSSALVLATPAKKGNTKGDKKDQNSQKHKQAKRRNSLSKSSSNLSTVKKKESYKPTPWSITCAAAGQFLHTDPIFSDDERHVLIPSRKGVHVFSTSSSLEEASLKPAVGEDIVAAAKTTLADHLLFSATSAGKITLWKWKSRQELDQWDVKSPVSSLVTSTSSNHSTLHAYTLLSSSDPNKPEKEEPSKVFAREVCTKNHKFIGEETCILNSSTPIHHLYALKGNVLVAVTSRSLLVGRSTADDVANFKWHNLPLDHRVTCLDLKYSAAKSGQQSDVDIAIGAFTGEIFVYRAVFSELEKHSSGRPVPSLVPQKLHWHRNAIGSVKWSRDGNYLISGGQETVLVLWQLSTGTHSTLPHLTAEIDNIVVSPFGASYAIRLSDNSILVLSTAELKPISYISGIQARALPSSLCRKGTQLETLVSRGGKYHSLRTPLVSDPKNSSLVHMAVPLSQLSPSNHQLPPAPFLQTFDFWSNRHVRKQALTRNHTTYPKVGPNRMPIFEPDVTLVDMSFEGNWLFTVEEWTPPSSDFNFLGSFARPTGVESEKRSEVFLKVWKWDSAAESWALNTRIENPHGTSGNLVHSIRDLAAHPFQLAFTTIGDDCIVRVWTPKMKTRNGVLLRGTDNLAAVSWSCASVTELRKGAPFVDVGDQPQVGQVVTPSNARLAYSPDGSVIAASVEMGLESEDCGTVHFIDSSSGSISSEETGMYSSGLIGLAFAGRHVVVLSKSVCVWDVVSNQRVYTMGIKYPELPQAMRADFSHLVANSSGTHFAVAVPVTHWKTGSISTEVSVFSPRYPDGLLSTVVPGVVTALRPMRKSDGFIVLSSNAEISVIHPPRGRGMFEAMGTKVAVAVAVASGKDRQKQKQTLAGPKSVVVGGVPSAQPDGMDVDGDSGDDEDDGRDDGEDGDGVGGDDDGGKPVVRAIQLSGIFEAGPSSALPPLESLFRSVAEVVMAKPRADGVAY